MARTSSRLTLRVAVRGSAASYRWTIAGRCEGGSPSIAARSAARARSLRASRSSPSAAGTARHARRSPPRSSTPTTASSATCGTVAEAALDVVGVHVLAVRRDDDVLEAPEDLEAALLVDAPEVARVEPPVRVDRLASRLRVGVAEHHVGAACDDLADAPCRRRRRSRSSTPGTGLPTPASRRLPGRATVSTGAASVRP